MPGRFGGSSSSTDTSRSANSISASVRGIGVADMTSTCGAFPFSATRARWAEAPAPPPALARNNLHLVDFDSAHPFTGREPDDRAHFAHVGGNGGDPFGALALLDADDVLVGHAVWYPLANGRAAFTDFRIAPALRNQGLGGYLLDSVLNRMITLPPILGGYTSVELLTHLLRNAPAVRLYEAHGFVPVAAWVQMEKT